jgi:hypothetical protein
VVYVYPGIALHYNGSADDWTSVPAASQPVYIQLFANATDQASAGPPPTCTAPTGGGSASTANCVNAYAPATGAGVNAGGNNGLFTLLAEIFGWIVGLLEQLIYWLFATIVTPIIVGVLQIHPYQDTFVAIIYPGWTVVRNLCDMAFIVALIVIAMATLFRIESYQYKHLLVQLIIAALLVNFSLVICQIILGIADTVQVQFLGQSATTINSLASNLMVGARNIVINYSQTQNQSAPGAGNMNIGGQLALLVQPIFWLALSLGSFAVFCALAVFLVIRIIALWILLMISPVAYVCGILPSTAHYRDEWWKNFLKYAFFTPIMAFFLNMAAVIFISQQQNPVFQQISSGATGFGNISTLVISVASYVLLLVFLIAGLMVSEKLGIYGATGITDAAKKYGIFAPFTVAGKGLAGTGKAVGGAAGSWAQRKKTEVTTKLFGDVKPDEKGKVSLKGRAKQAMFAAFNPGAVKSMLGKRREKMSEETGHIAEKAAEELVRTLPMIKEPPLALQAEAFVEEAVKKGKEETPYSSERQANAVVKQIESALDRGNKSWHTQLEFVGAVDQLIQGKGFNFMLEQRDYEVSSRGAIKWVNDQVKKGRITKDQAGHLMSSLSKHAYDNNEYWYAELYQLDHHGHPQIITTDKTTGEIEGKTEFQTESARFETEFNAFITAEAARTGATTPAQIEALRKKHRTNRQNKFEEDLEKTDHKKSSLYKNYKAFQGANKEAYINYTKKGARDRVAQGHWSMVADIDQENNYNASIFTVRHMLDADASDFAQAGHMNKKKRVALQRMVEDMGDGGGWAVAKPKLVNKMLDEMVQRQMQDLKDHGKQADATVEATVRAAYLVPGSVQRVEAETKSQDYYDKIIK